MKSRLLIAIFAAVFIYAGTAYGVSFLDLGKTVTGISGNGSVVFNSTSRWTAAGGWETWGSDTGGVVTGEVSVVSYDGSVVAGSSGNTAYHWSASTGLVNIGNFPSNYSYSITDISADGSMVVGTASEPGNYDDTHEAFLWASGSGMVGLGLYTNANGVTSDGSIIAGATGTPPNTAWPPSAAFWTEINDWTVLDPTVPGSYDSATSIADNGTMVITSIFGPSIYPQLWSPDTGYSDLGDPIPGNEDKANDISSDGSTVVGWELLPCPACFWPWVWDETNGRRYIDAILFAEGIDLSDWAYLSSAVSVSSDGLLIVGNGTNTDGIRKGWILNLDIKVNTCHYQEGNDSWKLLSVGSPAADAHLRTHDDALPGGTTTQTRMQLDANCIPVTAR